MNRVSARAYPDLATWREAQKLSQIDAARLLGISQSAYSRLERRVQTLPGRKAKQITQQTGVPLEVLVGAA